MFAILESGSKQYKIAVGDVIQVERLKEEETKKKSVTFETVLLIHDGKTVHIGDPYVKNGRVKAKILDEIKADKIIVFKKKPKKQYKRTRGHRQILQPIQIEKIEIKAAAKAKEKENE